MNISSNEFLWNEEKDKWVLVKLEEDENYVIINRVEQTMLLIEDDTLSKAIKNEMLKHGNKVFDTIIEAYESIDKK